MLTSYFRDCYMPGDVRTLRASVIGDHAEEEDVVMWDRGAATVVQPGERSTIVTEAPVYGTVRLLVGPASPGSRLFTSVLHRVEQGSTTQLVGGGHAEQIAYVFRGSGRCGSGDEWHDLPTGSTVHAVPGCDVAIEAVTDLELFVVVFSVPIELRGETGAPTTGGPRPAKVLLPDHGDSYWQPEPAGQYATVKISPLSSASNHFSMGTQHVRPGGTLTAHAHERNEELKFIAQGSGYAMVDGIRHPVEPGTILYTGRWVTHEFHNESDDDLVIVWTFLPPGLEFLLAGMGRARTPGEERPDGVDYPPDMRELMRSTFLATPGRVAKRASES